MASLVIEGVGPLPGHPGVAPHVARHPTARDATIFQLAEDNLPTFSSVSISTHLTEEKN